MVRWIGLVFCVAVLAFNAQVSDAQVFETQASPPQDDAAESRPAVEKAGKPPEGKSGRGIVAVVNGSPVTRFEFESFLRRRVMEIQQEYGPSVVEKNAAQIAEQALDDLILRKLLLQHCDEVKIDVPEEFVERRIEGKIEELKRGGARFTSAEEFLDSYEAAFGLAPGKGRQHIREELRIFELRMRIIPRDVFISPGELRGYYRTHGDQFATDPTHRFRQILIDRDQEDLERILDELEKDQANGVAFEKLVERYSQGPRRSDGGLYELTDTELDDWKAPVPSIVRGLKPGETSEPLSSDLWVHIVTLEERVAAKKLPFEEAQSRIKETIAEERRQLTKNKFETELRERAFVEIFISFETED